MSSLINLLPSERVRAFRQGYFFRLGTVSALGITVLLIIHGILLVPAYFTLAEARANEEERLASVKEQLASSGDQEITQRLSELHVDTQHLATLAAVPSATATVRAVLLLPRGGITLTGFSFTPPAGNTPGQMRISGIAGSRESLRAYQSTLAALPGVSNADLPISAYAKESDIAFTVTLTGSFSPIAP